MKTITREQFLTIAGCESSSELARKLEQIGITIADPEPPEAMVKLARTIARVAGCDGSVLIALAALQHVERAVRAASSHNDWAVRAAPSHNDWVRRDCILTAIGAKP